ncbi:hypothetical protein A1D23_05270 [Chelonobacter oris]|nr:hypothetical protein [Chelonobacter oris]
MIINHSPQISMPTGKGINCQTASAHYCEDCDEPIPELRRQTISGCTRCVSCQQIAELKAKGYRR